MPTPRVYYDPPMTRKFVAAGLFEQERFFLVDVGVSGGIEQLWRVFADQLSAVGFDLLVNECDRLNKVERSGDISYHAYRVTSEVPLQLKKDGKDDKLWSNDPFSRTSAFRAQELLNTSGYEMYSEEGDNIVLTEESTSLDKFLLERQVDSVDFIKIDTDGHDYEVIRGAENTLREREVLGLFVECQFHGPVHPEANVFSNIDSLLRDHGFSLFDIEVYRYTRGTLPGKFVYEIPAQTTTGQVLASDALYLRDVCGPNYEIYYGMELTPTKLLKLACIFEIFGMSDCAAELLLTYKSRLADLVDIQECMDLLTENVDSNAEGYTAYKTRFEADVKAFFPNRANLAVRRQGRRVVNVLKRFGRYARLS